MVGREDVGEVAFLYPVSLLDLNLDATVELDRGKVQVYGLDKGPSLPRQGTGLIALPCSHSGKPFFTLEINLRRLLE